MLQALQVTSPAGFKGKGSAGWRCSRCRVTSGVWRDHPGCLCVFSWHWELQRASARTWPGRSSQTHTGRPNRTNAFFCSKRDRVSPGGRFQATSQDDSLFPISQVSESSVWARHSETLLTPDCAAAARAEATYNLTTTKPTISRSCLLQPTIYRTARGQFWRSVAVVSSLMGKGWVSNAFGPTNVFPDAWWAPQGPMHIFSACTGAWSPSNQPRHLCTPAATSYLRFIMDAQRPRLHFVQLNPARPDARGSRSPKTDWRGLRYLFHLQCFAEAHESSIWAVSSAMPAQPPLGSSPELLHRSLPLGFLHLLHPPEVDHGNTENSRGLLCCS